MGEIRWSRTAEGGGKESADEYEADSEGGQEGSEESEEGSIDLSDFGDEGSEEGEAAAEITAKFSKMDALNVLLEEYRARGRLQEAMESPCRLDDGSLLHSCIMQQI